MDNTTGTLQVQVYTSRAALPVRDATVVVVRRAPSGKYDLLSIQSTDSSGKIRLQCICSLSSQAAVYF